MPQRMLYVYYIYILVHLQNLLLTKNKQKKKKKNKSKKTKGNIKIPKPIGHLLTFQNQSAMAFLQTVTDPAGLP